MRVNSLIRQENSRIDPMLHIADTSSKSTIKTVEQSQAGYRPLT